MFKTSRIDSIDFWRGFILVSIFVNHIPGNSFEILTHKNIGFSDATEAFVFLSGISVALAYGKRFTDGDISKPARLIGRRVLTIYGVQLLLSLMAIALFFSAAFLFDDDGLLAEHGRDVVLAQPLHALLAIAGLSHQLGYFNILPLYVVLLLATPAFLAIARSSRLAMVAVSAMVYALARIYAINLPTWPIEGDWFFNPFAWQFLYCIGLFIGLNIRSGTFPQSRFLTVMSILLVVFAALVTTGLLGARPELWDAASELFDLGKTDLGLARLMHFLALIYLLQGLGVSRLLAGAPVYKPLCLIGSHSLPVFATGSVLSALGQITFHVGTLAFFDEVILIGIGIAVHYQFAKVVAARATRRKITAIPS